MSQALQERRTRDTSEKAQPLSDVERLRRMLDQTFGSFGLPSFVTESVGWSPPVEIEEREREGILRKRTRRIGRFEYRVRLPEQVDPDNVEAKLKDGVLSVRVP